MIKKKLGLGITLMMAAIAVFWGCSKSADSSSTGDVNKDFKIDMLTRYADSIIIPGYADLQTKLNQFDDSLNAFLDNPTAASQQALKPVFARAYVSFQTVSLANFGPAASVLFNGYTNSFPCNKAAIETAIQSGIYQLNQPIASDSIQGFPALDYLLFENSALQQLADTAAAKRKQYIRNIIALMKTREDNTLSQWKGSYRNTFINATQTNVGSSIGYLINQLAFELDALKGPRIGWPFGKRSNGIVFADKCEAYYSSISRELALANLNSIKRYYTGGNGAGVDDYLVKLDKASLNNEVLAQFDVVINALTAIPNPLSSAFTLQPTTVDNAYKEIQKLLTLLKTDVASAMAVQVTYLDNDGD